MTTQTLMFKDSQNIFYKTAVCTESCCRTYNSLSQRNYRKYHNNTPILVDLHWIHVEYRVKCLTLRQFLTNRIT